MSQRPTYGSYSQRDEHCCPVERAELGKGKGQSCQTPASSGREERASGKGPREGAGSQEGGEPAEWRLETMGQMQPRGRDKCGMKGAPRIWSLAGHP